MKVTVYHSYFNCESGCCGHTVELREDNGAFKKSKFKFTHPYGKDEKEFVKELVTTEFGADHVADVDWENVDVSDE